MTIKLTEDEIWEAFGLHGENERGFTLSDCERLVDLRAGLNRRDDTANKVARNCATDWFNELTYAGLHEMVRQDMMQGDLSKGFLQTLDMLSSKALMATAREPANVVFLEQLPSAHEVWPDLPHGVRHQIDARIECVNDNVRSAENRVTLRFSN